jgi:hypothetical protein
MRYFDWFVMGYNPTVLVIVKGYNLKRMGELAGDAAREDINL